MTKENRSSRIFTEAGPKLYSSPSIGDPTGVGMDRSDPVDYARRTGNTIPGDGGAQSRARQAAARTSSKQTMNFRWVHCVHHGCGVQAATEPQGIEASCFRKQLSQLPCVRFMRHPSEFRCTLCSDGLLAISNNRGAKQWLRSKEGAYCAEATRGETWRELGRHEASAIPEVRAGLIVKRTAVADLPG